jgi:hypothetical protein
MMRLAPGEFISSTSCPKGSTASATTGRSPAPPAKPVPRARELIAAPAPSVSPSREHEDVDLAAGAAADYRTPCPCCGGRMIIVETFERGGAPSPEAGVKPGMP